MEMIKVAHYNDLHCEFSNFKLPKDFSADLLILAGDIIPLDLGESALYGFFEQIINLKIPVIYVPGNHEYYTTDTDMVALNNYFKTWIPRTFELTNNNIFHFIDKPQAINLDIKDRKIHVIAGTMWTDYGGKDFPNREECIQKIVKRMHDYKYIHMPIPMHLNSKDFEVRLPAGPHHFESLNSEFKELFEKNIRLSYRSEPTLIVTHHSPIFSLDPNFASSDLNHAYTCTWANDWIKNMSEGSEIIYWYHGHTHECYSIPKYRRSKKPIFVKTNARGYEEQDGKNPGFCSYGAPHWI